MKISDVMTADIRTCSPDDPASRATALMWDADCGCVPVIDQDRRVIGLLTDRDVAMAAYFQSLPLDQISVQSAMSRDVAVCKPLDTPEAAELIMQQRRVRRLPVVDDRGVLVGMVSLADIVYQMAHRQTFGADGMSWIAIGRTFAAICEPRHREPDQPPL
jgi:CBS domain-containing protein